MCKTKSATFVVIAFSWRAKNLKRRQPGYPGVVLSHSWLLIGGEDPWLCVTDFGQVCLYQQTHCPTRADVVNSGMCLLIRDGDRKATGLSRPADFCTGSRKTFILGHKAGHLARRYNKKIGDRNEKDLDLAL